MPVVSSDSLQLSHVEMTDGSTIPASPTFVMWRTTGESLVFEPNTTESEELGGDGRSRKPANVVGTTVSGDINFELAKFDALEQAIEGVLAEDWGECPLTGTQGGAIDGPDRITVGKDDKFYLIEKRFPNPAAVEGAVPAATADAPSASVIVTVTGAAAVGTGVIMVELAIDSGVKTMVESPISVGDDNAAAAAALDVLLNAEDGVTSTDNLDGTLTVTPTTGAAFTTFAVRSGNDTYQYQRFIGASYSVMTVNAAPNATVTGSVSVVGGIPALDRLPLEGATYTSAGTSAVFTAPEVMELSVGTMFGLSTSCWSTLTITLDSANRGIPCIGTQGDREVVLGTLAASLAGDVYFSDQAVLQVILDNGTVGDGAVVFSNADNETYRFDFFDMKPTTGSVSAGGTGEDVTMPLTFEPTPQTVCDDGGTGIWTSHTIISRDLNTAPTLP